MHKKCHKVEIKAHTTVADLEGGRASSAPPPLGDGLTPSLTVMLANAKCDRSTVNMVLRIIQNDCHQWISDNFRVQRIYFRLGLRPGPNWGSYSAPSEPLAGLRGPTSKGGERGGRGKREKRGRGRGQEGPAPSFANSWIRPCTSFNAHVAMLTLNLVSRADVNISVPSARLECHA